MAAIAASFAFTSSLCSVIIINVWRFFSDDYRAGIEQVAWQRSSLAVSDVVLNKRFGGITFTFYIILSTQRIIKYAHNVASISS